MLHSQGLALKRSRLSSHLMHLAVSYLAKHGQIMRHLEHPQPHQRFVLNLTSRLIQMLQVLAESRWVLPCIVTIAINACGMKTKKRCQRPVTLSRSGCSHSSSYLWSGFFVSFWSVFLIPSSQLFVSCSAMSTCHGCEDLRPAVFVLIHSTELPHLACAAEDIHVKWGDIYFFPQSLGQNQDIVCAF